MPGRIPERNSDSVILELEPFLGAEDEDGREGDDEHDTRVDPETVRIVRKGYGSAHGHHVRIERDREEYRRKNREDFHRQVELVRQEGIVGRFKGFYRLLGAFEDIPDADIGPDQVLEIDPELVGDERLFLL